MTFTKEHKWILASQMQKSIRYGAEEETLWSVSNLYDVDRAYMAYRLSVILFEDVLSGEHHLENIIKNEKWGAKKFNDKKSKEDKELWIKLALNFCKSIKDRTPCKWSSCTRWLNEFEQIEGKWECIEPYYAIECAMTEEEKPWWWRGLMAWRAVGTERFPNNYLPKNTQGDFDAWISETSDDEVQHIMSIVGKKQIEPHVLFLPLCLEEQNKTENIDILEDKCPINKCKDFLLPAIDKHTREGKQAICHFYENYLSQSVKQNLITKIGVQNIINFIGTLMFYVEGDKLNKSLCYPTSYKMDRDIKKKWLKTYNINGRWVFDNLVKPQLWNKSRRIVLENNGYLVNLNHQCIYSYKKMGHPKMKG